MAWTLDDGHDLVSYATKGLAKLDIRPAPTDIRQVGREIAGEYRAQVEAAGLDLQLDLPEDIPADLQRPDPDPAGPG